MSTHGRHARPRRRAGGSSLTSSRRGRSGWSSTRARRSARSARDLDLTRVGAARVGASSARADRTQGQDRADDRRARGAGAAAERESRAADGARHPKKSRGLLREAPAVRFALDRTRRRPSYPDHDALSVPAACRRAGSTPGGSDRSRRTRSEIAGCGCWCARRSTASQQRYGSPRVHEDLLEQDERVSRKRVIRLMQEDGLEARVAEAVQGHDDERSRSAGRGQSARPAVHGRRGPNQRWVGDTTEFVIGEQRQALSGGDPRSVLAVRRRLGRQRRQRSAPDDQGARDGAEAAVSRRRPAASLRPGLHVRERGLPGGARRARHHLQHEPSRQLLRQRRDGELLLDA